MIRIEAPHYVAGALVENDVVIKAAPIIKYMKGWSTSKVIWYCNKKHWSVAQLAEHSAVNRAVEGSSPS